MARDVNNWLQITAGDGAITLDPGGKRATCSAGGPGNIAYLRRIIDPNPGDVVELVTLAKRISGNPWIIIDYPASASAVQSVRIDSDDFFEYRAAWVVPRRKVSGQQVIVNAGVFQSQEGVVELYDPQVTVNGIDIDTVVPAPVVGSNANGNYIKYPDGRLICYKNITVTGITIPWGGVFTGPLVDIGTMPYAFVGDFDVFATCKGPSYLTSGWVYSVGTGLGTRIGVARGSSDPGAFTVRIKAEGRWKA